MSSVKVGSCSIVCVVCSAGHCWARLRIFSDDIVALLLHAVFATAVLTASVDDSGAQLSVEVATSSALTYFFDAWRHLVLFAIMSSTSAMREAYAIVDSESSFCILFVAFYYENLYSHIVGRAVSIPNVREWMCLKIRLVTEVSGGIIWE